MTTKEQPTAVLFGPGTGVVQLLVLDLQERDKHWYKTRRGLISQQRHGKTPALHET
jgi:hypothetical protein